MDRRIAAVVVALALVAGSLTACGSDEDDARKALRTFLTAWQENRLAGRQLLDATGAPLPGERAQEGLAKVEGELAARRPKLGAGKLTVRETDATAQVTVDWPVADGVTWNYPTTVRLAKRKDSWLPVFSPQTVHPDLASFDTVFTRSLSWPERAGVLDGAGQPIVRNLPVVTVGVEPARVTDPAVLVGGLKSIFAELGLDVGVDDLPERLRNAGGPQAFIEVAVLRREAYDRVRRPLQDLPGTVFRTGTRPLAPTAAFARGLLGQVGDVTKEILDQNPGRYKGGDQVGLSGLQRRYDDRLRGRPGVTVRAGDQKTDKVMFEAAPAAGPPLGTTLDVGTQNAADAALAGTAQRSALVAVRISDGALIAVANGPGGGRVNLAFTAAVPPGSTFKMVSTYGLLSAGGVGPDTPVDCPATAVVEGRTFKNADGLGALGTVPFRTAFARSCNTAFTALAPKLGPDGLAKAGTALGIGVPWDLGAEANPGTVATGGSATDQAAAAFGQGTTVVSPVVMAAATAAVARGQWKQPRIVLDPAPGRTAPDGPALDPAAAEALRAMMREVVTAGSGTALKGLPGTPVYGKTGTAEFDSADPAKTHAWFIGWKGDVAFAVFVEGGGGGSATAVPIAGKFLTTLGV